MKHALALATALTSLPAFAVDFTGHWVGTGTMFQKGLTGTTQSPCSKVEVIVEHLPNKLTVQKYNAVCGIMNPEWGPYPFEIRGTKVFEDGEETGTLEGNLLKTLQASGGVQYAFNLRLQDPPAGQAPVMETYYGVRNLVGTIVIEASIPRAP